MVHDEEAEISIRLATLIANSQRNRSSAVGSMPLDLPEAPVRTNNDSVADGRAATQAEALQGTPAM